MWKWVASLRSSFFRSTRKNYYLPVPEIPEFTYVEEQKRDRKFSCKKTRHIDENKNQPGYLEEQLRAQYVQQNQALNEIINTANMLLDSIVEVNQKTIDALYTERGALITQRTQLLQNGESCPLEEEGQKYNTI